KTRFDQSGLMLRTDHEHWIKAGVEYVDGKLNVSAVVTNIKSDWNVISLKETPASVWIKAVRRLDAIELFYSRGSLSPETVSIKSFGPVN
ncbi:MAG TPA: DUF1349 domain-containing protein, partial [Arachidicoccus sp.]